VKGVLAALRRRPPLKKEWLWRYVRVFLNYRVPVVRVCGHHVSPMDYLWYAYSCDRKIKEHKNSRTEGHKNHGQAELDRGTPVTGGDCIVWANRGGGKTQLAAVATLLEMLFKPKCQTLILAGSLEQSGRMYESLREFVERKFKDYLDGGMLTDSCRFQNGATVEALAQSARAVRGRHVHKLRCDEIELFDEDVFNAAKFITHSTEGHTAAMEILSTMHRPYGLMQKVIEAAPQSGIPIFKWCVWEVIERCRPERSCSRCALSNDCGGRARRAQGYLKIDDVISQMRRSSRAGFGAEMLCLRPNLENAVFAEFDPAVHVKPVGYDANLPLFRSMDFGFTNPFVCLWIQTDRAGTVRVIDEYVQARRVIAEHARQVQAKTPCDESGVQMTFCDPSGSGPNDVTGTGSVKELKDMGFKMKHRPSRINDGIEKIRTALRAGDGQSRLVIDPKCRKLIEALRCYHYPDAGAAEASELPKKDGVYDHPMDALRYFFVNFYGPQKSEIRRY
jgi:hypothetical protein